MITFLEKRPILTIVTVVGVMLFPFLDVLEVTIMEARNFVTAREMLTEGNWVLTTFNGEPRYQKPPLPTWFSAISASVFGINSVWGMRFPAVLMVMLLGSMVFMLSRKLTLSRRHSLINGLVGISALYIVLIIFEAPWDIYAHTFMLGGIYALFSYLQPTGLAKRQGARALRSGTVYLVLGAVFIGMSILSKGPVSLYVLFLSFVIAYLIVFRKVTLRKKWSRFVVSVLFGVCAGAIWYLYVRYADPVAFARISSKETSNWTGYNVRPFYYYWSFFVQTGLWSIPAFVSLLYPYMKSRVANLKVYRFTLLWTVIAVVLLSIIPEKKSRYLMPVLIPLVINIGFYIEYLVREFKVLKNWRETLVVYFNIGLVAVCFIVLSLGSIFYSRGIQGVSMFGFTLAIFSTAIGVWILLELRKKNIYNVILGVIFGLTMTLQVVSYVRECSKEQRYIDDLGDTNYRSFEHLEDLPIYSLSIHSPEVIWSVGRKIKVLSSLNESVSDNTYYLLVCSDCAEVLTRDFSLFTPEFQGNFDLNYTTVNAGGYKERNSGKIYKMTRR